MNKRSKACDISPRVKREVWVRDGGCCILCGNDYNVMPNAHYIPRSRGGLGIAENVVTLCTVGGCEGHRKFDQGSREERAEIREKIKEYLQDIYPDWNENKLTYHKYDY